MSPKAMPSGPVLATKRMHERPLMDGSPSEEKNAIQNLAIRDYERTVYVLAESPWVL